VFLLPPLGAHRDSLPPPPFSHMTSCPPQLSPFLFFLAFSGCIEFPCTMQRQPKPSPSARLVFFPPRQIPPPLFPIEGNGLPFIHCEGKYLDWIFFFRSFFFFLPFFFSPEKAKIPPFQKTGEGGMPPPNLSVPSPLGNLPPFSAGEYVSLFNRQGSRLDTVRS